MSLAVILVCPALLGYHVSDLAEIVERAQGAAVVSVTEANVTVETKVPGTAFRAAVEEILWGDTVPSEIVVWAPLSPCGTPCKAPRLILGYRHPTPARADYFGLPEGVFLACGSVPDAPGLAERMRRLKEARTPETLLELMNDESADIREQAFRQLRERFLKEEDGPEEKRAFLGKLLELASRETDPKLLQSYLTAFGHFRYGKAADFVAETLLRREDGLAAAGAEWAFGRVADARCCRRVIAAYGRARPGIKRRILRALAPVKRPETQALFSRALKDEKTILPALRALAAAGRPLPREIPRVRSPLRALRIRSFLRRRQSRSKAPAEAPNNERRTNAGTP